MSMYKVKSAIAGGVIAAVMAAAALSGTIIQAMSDNSYKSWKQYGETWSSMTLGSSGETVARSGCAVTSAAILMVRSGSVTDDSFTPGKLVGYMSANGGFTSGGSINWNKLTSYAPSFVYCGKSALSGTQQQKAEKMQSLMDQGYYLIAVVKNGGHFVAVDSVSGSSVTMMDPGSRSTSLFEKYAASGVVSLRLFKGANSTAVTPEETIPAETTEPIETTVTEVETTEETVLYTTEPEAPETDTAEEPTEAAIVPTETETETTTTETTKETTTTVVTTTTAAAAPAAPAAAPAETSVAVTEELPPAPAPFVVETPVIPAETTAAVTPAETVIPSYADAGLFRVRNQNLFMTVRFTTTDNLHLREDPNTDSDILLVIPEGTELDVVEIDEEFTWGRVAYNGREGWISLDFAGL